MNGQVKHSFLGSKAFRVILLAVLAILLVTSSVMGRTKMTLAGGKAADTAAASRHELVEAR